MIIRKVKWKVTGIIMLLAACTSTHTHNQAKTTQSDSPVKWPSSFGFGRPATPQEIALLDIDVRPDGIGLPIGSGTVGAGKAIYATKCAVCHGKTGVEGPNNSLVSDINGSTSQIETVQEKTIGNYWPYATTLFDYIRRAMPFNAPGSLSNEEVYAVTAFLLHANKIIPADAILNAKTLPQVIMPAQKYFVPDDRRGGSEIR